MDVLSDVLDTVRLQGTVWGGAELAPPWGIRAPPRDVFVFHVVARGGGWLEADGAEPVRVGAGDVLVLSRGIGHTLRDAPGSPVRPLDALFAEGVFGRRPQGTPGATHLLCGGFRLEDPRRDVLLAALPPVIHTHELASDVGPWLAQTVRLLTHEAGRGHPGGETVVSRLCDALFVYVIRSVLDRGGGEASWLRGLADPHVGAALELIHEAPSEPWSVATLAAKVGMSRSAFAERFTRVVGESPMRYLARWRLEKAAGLIRGSDAGLAEIAARVGYESDAAFNKAFKRSMGVAPGAYRRAWRAAEATPA